MKKISVLTYSLVLWMLLGSCIHEYPQEVESKATPVNVTLELAIDTELPLYGNFSRSANAADDLCRRFIVDVYRDGKVLEEKRICTTEATVTAEGTYILPVSLQLDTQPYTFVVWSDYVQNGSSADLHFQTGQLSNVSLSKPYHNDYRQRESFCGSLSVDLTECRNDDSAEFRQRIPLKRPQAKFRIVSTDVDEFITEMRVRSNGSGSFRNSDAYRIRVSYEYFFPTAYNVVGDVPCGSLTGIGFTAPCSIVADGDGMCELVSDFVFTGTDDSYVSLTLEVLNGTDVVISRVTGVQVPCRQGHLTVVSGKFLTTLTRPGISIDTDYDGEFNITL